MTDQPPQPVESDDDDAPPRLFGWMFWAAIVFGALCIGAGYVFAHLGPQLFPLHPPAHLATPARGPLQIPGKS